MQYPTRNRKPIWLSIGILLLVAVFIILVFSVNDSSMDASAHANPVFGPACGKATMDGNVQTAEWSGASKKTFPMTAGSVTTTFTATLYVMNSGNYLYLGITINDNEFTTYGEFLSQGDGFRIDFDNDHSGSVEGLNDDVLVISAGSPQFHDSYVYNLTGSSDSDTSGGGTSDGSGAASRINNLNHFELRHPLCSGDTLDFCLHPANVVGVRLEYLDAQADHSFGGTQFYPGTSNTSIADIVIASCSPLSDMYTYLPLVRK
jgi:hypothetical protein